MKRRFTWKGIALLATIGLALALAAGVMGSPMAAATALIWRSAMV